MRVLSRLLTLAASMALSLAAPAEADGVKLPEWTTAPGSPIRFVGAAGAASASVESTESPTLVYGFRGTARGIRVDGSSVVIERFELSPPASGSFSSPEHPLKGYEPAPHALRLVFNQGESPVIALDCSTVVSTDPFGGTREEGGAHLVVEGWHIMSYELSLGPTGLIARRGFVSSGVGAPSTDLKAVFDTEFESLCLDPSWTPVEARFVGEPFAMIGEYCDLAVRSAELVRRDGILAVELSFNAGATNRYGVATPYESAVISGTGALVSSELARITVVIQRQGGFELELESSSLGDGFVGTGSVRLSEALGSAGPFATEADAVKAWKNGYDDSFTVAAFAEPVTFTWRGWTVVAPRASVESNEYGDGLCLRAQDAYIEYRGARIALSVLAVSEGGYLIECALPADGYALPLYGGRMNVIESSLDKDGLSVKSFVSLPDELGGYSIYFDRIDLAADGSFTLEDPVERFSFDTAAGTFVLSDVRLSEDGIRAGQAYFTPTALGSGPTVRMYGVALPNEGGLACGAAGNSIDPFRVGSFYCGPAEVRIEDGGLVLDGALGYPESYPAGLRGRKAPAVIKLPLDGSAPSVESVAEESLTVSFGSAGAALSMRKRTVEMDGAVFSLRLDAVSLVIKGAAARDAVIDGVYLRDDGTYDLSRAVLARPFAYEFDGIRFALSSIKAFSEERVLFSGTATLPGEDSSLPHGCALSVGMNGQVSAWVVTNGESTRYDKVIPSKP